MIVNIPFDLGYGLTAYLQDLGYSLLQRGNEWHLEGASNEAEAQTAIDSYNPWASEKALKMKEINNAFLNAVSKLVIGTTEHERNSWAIQESEAIAYSQNSNAQCPALTILSNSRGIPLSTLVNKILEKSALYKQHYFMLQGLRDKAEDLIKSLPDAENYERLNELQSIKFGE